MCDKNCITHSTMHTCLALALTYLITVVLLGKLKAQPLNTLKPYHGSIIATPNGIKPMNRIMPQDSLHVAYCLIFTVLIVYG